MSLTDDLRKRLASFVVSPGDIQAQRARNVLLGGLGLAGIGTTEELIRRALNNL